MGIHARLSMRHFGCMTERLGEDDFVVRISSDRLSDLVLMHAPDEARLAELHALFRGYSKEPVEILASSSTATLFRARNPPDELLRASFDTGCSYLLPNVYTGGEEHVEILAPDRASYEAFLARVRPYATVREREVTETRIDEMGPSLRLSELTQDLTPKQLDTLRQAVLAGFYQTPRRVTTRELAARSDVGRSTLEEHLRKAEQRVLARLAARLSTFPFPHRVALRKRGRPKKT